MKGVIFKDKSNYESLLDFCKTFNIELQKEGEQYSVMWGGQYFPFSSGMVLVAYDNNYFIPMKEKEYRTYYESKTIEPTTTTTETTTKPDSNSNNQIETIITIKYANEDKISYILLLEVLIILFMFLRTIIQ